MNFFKECTNQEGLRKAYKKLSKELHPDLGGCEETFKKMLNEYQDILKNGFTEIKNKFNFDNMTDDFKKAFMVASTFDIEAEIIGSWIWISGNTFNCKNELKAAGFKWASKKKMWYFGTTTTKSKGKSSIDQIRKTYGSEKIKSNNSFKIA